MDQSLYNFVNANLDNVASAPTVALGYLVTPKNACSTIKASLLGLDDAAHDLFKTTFLNGPVDFSKPIFCISRNPYDRAISAYLDKIVRQRSKLVAREFYARYQLDARQTKSFKEFLEQLKGHKTPWAIDEHFRPQVYTHNHAFIRPSFVGRFERMHEVQEFLRSYGINLRTFRPHATDASSKRGELSKIEIDLIRDTYKLDFETYGYSEDPRDFASPKSIEQEQYVSTAFEIAGMLRGTEAPRILAYTKTLLAKRQSQTAKLFCASAFIIDNRVCERSEAIGVRCPASPLELETRSGARLVSEYIDSLGVLRRFLHRTSRYSLHIEKVVAMSRYKIRRRMTQVKRRISRVAALLRL